MASQIGEETLVQTWAQRGIDPSDLATDATVLATSATTPRADPLPGLLEAAGPAGAAIELGDVLGEGGMGVVYQARQTAMGRSVAVKMLREGSAKAEDAVQLLREGRVTGLLEHPNVVPVHTLGQDHRGRPLIVMKRIDGTPWSDALHDVSVDRTTYLREHLGILQQVARALSFAHSLGVIHRDIKPDNVMLGSFGEVYLVDWGIAVCVSDQRIANVPRASSVHHIEGTPVYMSPEMAAGAGELLGVCSDVYLLGATLHHVVTGKPPHDGADIRDVLEHAFTSPTPRYGPDVPAELSAIASRAMAREPEDRFQSAAAFGEALEAYLLHAGSLELCDEGERRTDELQAIERDETRDAEVETLFYEARFAFTQAQRSWADNPRAARGLRRLLDRMIRFELRRGGARAALTLLRQHDDPAPGLQARVEEAVHRQAMLERDADVTFGIRERLTRVYLGSGAWTLACFVAGFVTRHDIFIVTHNHVAAYGCTYLVGSVVSIIRWRRTMLGNATNLAVATTSLVVFLLGVLLWPLLGAFGVPMNVVTATVALVNAGVWATLMNHVGRSWLPVPIAHVFVALLALRFPRFHFEIFGGLSLVGLLLAARQMRRDADRAPTSVPG